MASASTTVTKTSKRRSAGTKQDAQVKQKKEALEAANDFFWTYTEEPHRTRRIAIIKAHPEVRDTPPNFFFPRDTV